MCTDTVHISNFKHSTGLSVIYPDHPSPDQMDIVTVEQASNILIRILIQ